MTSGTKTSLLSTAAVLLLLLTAPAFCQEQASNPLAFTPTGDALWDTYAQALLEQLPDMPLDAGRGKSGAGVLPDELLAGWESEFSCDPRYWQLRFYNKKAFDTHRSYVYGKGPWFDDDVEYIEPAPITFLQQGKELGVTDWVTEIQLFEYSDWQLDWLQEDFKELTDEDKSSSGIPEFESKYKVYPWFVNQHFEWANNLVDALPDESWTYYKRAMKQFDHGRWEEGLNDLRSGNNAEHNRLPVVFPVSFVIDRIYAGEQLGSELAAGLVISSYIYMPLADYINIKDHEKELEIRLNIGASLDEIEPWYHYICNAGAAQYGDGIQWSMMVVMHNMLVRYMLVDSAEAYSVDQRGNLWSNYFRCRKIMDWSNQRLVERQKEISDEMEPQILALLAEYGIEIDKSAPVRSYNIEDYLTDSSHAAELEFRLNQFYFVYAFRSFALEHGEYYSLVKQRFDELASFDFPE